MEVQKASNASFAVKTWTLRFILAAIIQGAIIVSLTAFYVVGQPPLKPEVSRIIAGGGAGTWMTFGYIIYIIVGVLGVAVSALFYQYLPASSHRNLTTALSWIHFVLMNVGTTVACGLMMHAGYIGGASMLPVSVGGQGFDATHAHELIGQFVTPIAIAVIAILVSVLAGGLGFLISLGRIKTSE
jgi:heme/copper-type cytochrome/quinol oxidase subunit 1